MTVLVVPDDGHWTEDLVISRFDRSRLNHLFHRFTEGASGIVWRQLLSKGWDLDDQRRNPVVESDHDQRSTTTETIAPHPNASRIDFVKRSCKRDCIAIPPGLNPRIDLLARLATTLTKALMIEEQHGRTWFGENGCISICDHLLGCGEPMGHHDQWPG